MHAQNYGTLVNTAVAVKEMVHRIFKGMVPHTNLKQIELDLLRRYNTLQTSRYLIDGGVDHRFGESFNPYRNLINDDHMGKVLRQWFIFEGPIIIASNKNSGTGEDLDNAVNNKGKINNVLLKLYM